MPSIQCPSACSFVSHPPIFGDPSGPWHALRPRHKRPAPRLIVEAPNVVGLVIKPHVRPVRDVLGVHLVGRPVQQRRHDPTALPPMLDPGDAVGPMVARTDRMPAAVQDRQIPAVRQPVGGVLRCAHVAAVPVGGWPAGVAAEADIAVCAPLIAGARVRHRNSPLTARRVRLGAEPLRRGPSCDRASARVRGLAPGPAHPHESNASPAPTSRATFRHCRTSARRGARKSRPRSTIGARQYGQAGPPSAFGCLAVYRQGRHAQWVLWSPRKAVYLHTQVRVRQPVVFDATVRPGVVLYTSAGRRRSPR
jgi:hypothetical protein